MFPFQIGSIKTRAHHRTRGHHPSFDSILVRLKGFMKTINILYATLMSRVNSIFRITIFRESLLSTFGCAKLLGGLTASYRTWGESPFGLEMIDMRTSKNDCLTEVDGGFYFKSVYL